MVTHSQDPTEIINNFEAAGTDILQLHAPLFLEEYLEIKSLVPRAIANISVDAALKEVTQKLKTRICETSEIVDYILLDTKFGDEIGGTGKTYDWAIAEELKKYSSKPVIIAGGLNPQNVFDAVSRVSPFAVDVSSGVEALPGKKDFQKVQAFIRNAKSL
jgi:phosphoribosylanthranilate isomerase